MYEEDVTNPVETHPHSGGADHSSIVKYVLLGVALLYVLASLYFMYTLKNRLDALDQKQQTLESAQTELSARLHSTKSEFKEALTSEVGSAKTDIAKTQNELQATNQKLERTIGDLGVQSGLIAHTSAELDVLKHRGDRNYFDFTLRKGAKTPISTVSFELKKVDAKKSRFTLNVLADDKTIEKKDRTVGEPLQFYTGRDHLLYEVVVFSADKNSITGYLSTPKNAPKPVSPS
jgi:hypothetical protein